MKKIIYFISSVLAWIISFGVGIGVAVSSKVFAEFKDYSPLKDAVKEAEESLDAYAKEELTKEITKEETED